MGRKPIWKSSFKIFRTYFFAVQAEMDLNKLKNEGIDAYLSDVYMGGFSFYGVATGGVKLYVLENDLERVQEILPDKGSESNDG